MKRSNWLLNRLARPIRIGEAGNLDGLPIREPVEVLQDRWGIPHIFARNERDLMAAQGFLHARDRLWQMEAVRRTVSGTLSEVAGEGAVGLDCFSRLVGLDALRRRSLERLPARERGWFEAYAAGVNAYIEAAGGNLPLEFRSLGFTPAPWKVEDLAGPLAINAWFLQTNYQEEVLALYMRDRLTLEQWNGLFPGWPQARLPDADFFQRCRGLRIGPLLPEAMAYYPSLSGLAAGFPPAAPRPEAAAVSGQVPPAGPPPPGDAPPSGDALPGASNNWVVARGEGGAPLLANDPHLGVTVPPVWYICHLRSPELNVCGASLPGTPGIVIGRNEHLAWGVTNLMTDCVDLFVLRVDPRNPTRYLYRGEYRDMVAEKARLAVAGGKSRVFTIHRTLHGPVITRIEKGLDAVACLKWYGTWFDPGFKDTTLEGFLALNRARDLDQALAAVDRIATVGQNFLLADVQGHIAWRPSGRLPIRTGYSGRLPADGSSGRFDWSGFLPPERMPLRVDPPEGAIATANNRGLPEDCPHPVSHTWCAPYRHRRIVQLLQRLPAPTVKDFQAMQMDRRSLRAEHMVPVLLGFDYGHPLARRAASILKGWDYEARADSAGALVFNVFLTEATDLLLRPLLGGGVRVIHSVGPYLYNTLDLLFEAARRDGAPFPLPWPARTVGAADGLAEPAGAAGTGGPDGPPRAAGAAGTAGAAGLAGPAGGRALGELYEQALVRAMETIRRELGSRRRRWRWGALHTYYFRHPGARGRPAAWLLNRGRYPAGGDATTVNVAIPNTSSGATALDRYEAAAIPSLRLVCSLAGIDRTAVMAPMGQSGQPGHPHYDDLIRPWMRGRMVPLPLSREAAEGLAVRRLALRP